MANYTVNLAYSGGKGPTADWQYPSTTTTGTGHASTNPLDLEIGDTITFTASGGPGSATVSDLSIFTNNSSFDIAFSGNTLGVASSVVRTVASGGTTANTIRARKYAANATDFDEDFFYVERQAASVTIDPPDSITFGSIPTTYSSTVSVTATASGGGTGTLQVSLDGSTWVANGSSLSFTRGDTTTVYARVLGTGANSGYASSNFTDTLFVPFKTADLNVTVSVSPQTVSATSTQDITVTVSGATGNNQYQAVRNTSGPSARGDTGILAASATSGTITLHSNDTGDVPAPDGFYSYKIQGRVPPSKGGDTDGEYDDTTSSTFFVISRDAQTDSTPDSNWVNFQSQTNRTTNSVSTSNSQTITGISGDVSVSVSGDGSPEVSVNGGTFTSSPPDINNNQTIQVRLTNSNSNNITRTASVTVGTVTRTFSSSTVASGGSGSGTGSGGTDTHGIEVYDTDGTTKVLSPGTRYINIMNSPTSTTVANGSSVLVQQNMSGLTTSNSDIIFTRFGSGAFSLNISRVTSGPVSSQGFNVTNNTGVSVTFTPIIIRY